MVLTLEGRVMEVFLWLPVGMVETNMTTVIMMATPTLSTQLLLVKDLSCLKLSAEIPVYNW